jgi:hypothetical protein
MKTLEHAFRSAVEIRPAPNAQILGHGLPVRNMFDDDDPNALLASPFVFLDYVGPGPRGSSPRTRRLHRYQLEVEWELLATGEASAG